MSGDETGRWTTVGTALHETLKKMVKAKRISKREARNMLSNFDDVLAEELAQPPRKMQRANVKGEMVYYQCLDGKWNMKVREVEIAFQDDDGTVRRKLEGKSTVNIVAVEGAS